MTLIHFPAAVGLERVTPGVLRTDEVSISPSTGDQQVRFRGNPAHRIIFEHKDLSQDEREIVQAFLSRCRGAVNTWRAPFPANYGVVGSASLWTDVWSEQGVFSNVDSSSIGDTFQAGTPSRFSQWYPNVEGLLRLQWMQPYSGDVILPNNLGSRVVSGLTPGNAYYVRYTQFTGRGYLETKHRIETADVDYGNGPTPVYSNSSVTRAFVTHNSSVGVSVSAVGSLSGDYWDMANYRMARCLLVVNTENLLTRSNEFDHADWTAANCSVTSGYGSDPDGVDNSWKLFGNSINAEHTLSQIYTKTNTGDFFTFAGKFRQAEKTRLRLRIQDGTAAAHGFYDLATGSEWQVTSESGAMIMGAWSKMTHVGSDWYKCVLGAYVGSHTNVIVEVTPVNSDGSISWTDGVGSDGIEMSKLQLQQIPLAGPYAPTVTDTLVGSDYQDGATLMVGGADPGTLVARAGHRFEVVTQLYNQSSGDYEKSECKRLSRDAVADLEGNVLLDFDPPIRNVPTRAPSEYDSSLGSPRHTLHCPVIFNAPEVTMRVIAGTIQEVEKQMQQYDVTFEGLEDLA